MSSEQNTTIKNKMKLKTHTSKKSSSKSSISKKPVSKTKSEINNNDAQLLESNDDENIYGMEDYRLFYLNFKKQKLTSSNVMTKYEKAAVLGKRAQQIACGAIPLIKVPSTLNNAVDIAEEELRQKKNPYIIERDLGNGKKEHIKVREMVIY